jgi:hypothetical protein
LGKYWVTSEDGSRHRTAAGNAREYSRYQSSKKAKKDRAARNKARRQALREGRVHRGDNLEIDHKDSNPSHNSRSNLRVVSRTFNRSRKENSRRRGSRRIRSSWGV